MLGYPSRERLTLLHDCAHTGHLWLTPDNRPYVGHIMRKRDDQRDGMVQVHCQHCPARASLPHYAPQAIDAARARYGSPLASSMKP